MGKERPILFSGEMVRAILDGRKTQTRRVIRDARGAFWDHAGYRPVLHESGSWVFEDVDDPTRRVFGPRLCCPYGLVGDRLWVREAWQGLVAQPQSFGPGEDDWDWDSEEAEYIPESEPVAGYTVCYRDDNPDICKRWRPSIHMPRWASRITLEIVGVRVERVQQISYADALAEGVWRPGPYADPDQVDREYDARDQYRHLWDEINARRGYAWASNPWVWVVEFRRV